MDVSGSKGRKEGCHVTWLRGPRAWV